jgi:hypothetical protein
MRTISLQRAPRVRRNARSKKRAFVWIIATPPTTALDLTRTAHGTDVGSKQTRRAAAQADHIVAS